MNLPQAFIERTRQLLGEENYAKFEDALASELPVSIRPNLRKCTLPVEGSPVPWASSGVYLDKRPTFTFDPLFHAGCYYVQEASSMFVGQVLQHYVHTPVVMLDLCAAPGGKSTLCRSLLPEGSLLVANEVMRNRSQILAENLVKWGYPDVIVTNSDPAEFSGLMDLFDVILTDVPCSGEGMFRKDQVAVDEWSVENVDICWRRQRRILTDIWPALKPGGLLIYSTCTFNREEDEDNVAWIADELGADVLEVPVDKCWGITGNLIGKDFPVYRFMPHKTKGEGFFLAVLRKREGVSKKREDVSLQTCLRLDKKKKKKEQKGRPQSTLSVPKEVKHWLKESDAFALTVKETSVTAFPKTYDNELALLQQQVKVIHSGVVLGEWKGKDFIPHHSLAMSLSLQKGIFPEVEVSYEQAIAYLRKEGLILDAEVPRGYVLLTYRQVPLGFVKNIGNRANNLYPQEWRIRSGYLPEEVVTVW
ncbi:MAG: rRNA cytosine-C5-methyltransferase [Bacteroidaceae bacterium]|nr:rRNA cytosine-C5-methyltransferase [Bacteroidaceae bacterium]